MPKGPDNEKRISRRRIFPILGGTLLIPLLGFGRSGENQEKEGEDEEYQTLLKPDGTTVKVKKSALKKSKVIKKNISNSTFLNWLDKKF
ncbi:hypothetical protein [Lentiprolixibacter aurantiacus]|uniref:Uncharacterized protein n=1 Tax=Lentiprolixibacter aurantiacus TaxID=2993939 RepID=A0AAE3MMX6_9FLAO|nr:hypothetical protein [Lentiprolixibacter aurantiacus]MCX2720373.1 hypothetical protein [Lentiprolixibacter aurantiacus]